MVAAVRCPNLKCRKYMLVEDADQGKVVGCLICKQGIKVPATGGTPPAAATPPAREVDPLPAAEVVKDLTPIFDDDEPQFKLD